MMEKNLAGSESTWDFVRPEVITGRTPRLRSSFKVSRHTWIMNFDSTGGILTDLTLEELKIETLRKRLKKYDMTDERKNFLSEI